MSKRINFMLCSSLDSPKTPLTEEAAVAFLESVEKSDTFYLNRKYNGLRLGGGVDADGKIFIVNRRTSKATSMQIDYSKIGNMPDIEAELKFLPPDSLLDGEGVVYADPKACAKTTACKACKPGYPCRILTQMRAGVERKEEVAARVQTMPMHYIVWDVRRLAGTNMQDMPLHIRLGLLKQAMAILKKAGLTHIKMAAYYTKDFAKIYQEEPEGVVAKRKDSTYVPMKEGTQSSSRLAYWIKIKHLYTVIADAIGYDPNSTGKIEKYGMKSIALLYDGVYRGLVGTGLTDEQRMQVRRFFDKRPEMEMPTELWRQIHPDNIIYKPHTGLKVEVTYQELTAKDKFYAPKLKKLIYPT